MNTPTIEDFKKIINTFQKNKCKFTLPFFAIIAAEDLNDLLDGNFNINLGTHIEKDGNNIFVV